MAFSAEASSPCSLPQLSMQPGTNSTGVTGPLRVSSNLPDLANHLQVTTSDGTPVAATFTPESADYAPTIDIGGLNAPGWYIVKVDADTSQYESQDRSLWSTDDGFVGQVLVGKSAPSVSLVQQCLSSTENDITISWSEPVTFSVDPAQAIQLRANGNGQLLTCENLSSAWDGGVETSETFSCDQRFQVTSIELVNPPQGLDGSVAVFPTPGTPWAINSWTGDYCYSWQPDVRQQGHDSLAAANLGPSYDKCPWNQSGCSATGPALLGGLAWVVFLVLRRRRAS